MNKKILLSFFFFIGIISTQKICAETVPFQFNKTLPTSNFSDSNLAIINHLSIKEIEKLAGRKLNFKEKIAIKIYKSNPALYNHIEDSTEDKKLEKKALWSKWLGIGSLIGLFVPGVGLLSLPAAILAIVFGTSTQNKVKNKRDARQGITFGIITIGIILLLVALVVSIVTSFGVR